MADGQHSYCGRCEVCLNNRYPVALTVSQSPRGVEVRDGVVVGVTVISPGCGYTQAPPVSDVALGSEVCDG